MIPVKAAFFTTEINEDTEKIKKMGAIRKFATATSVKRRRHIANGHPSELSRLFGTPKLKSEDGRWSRGIIEGRRHAE